MKKECSVRGWYCNVIIKTLKNGIIIKNAKSLQIKKVYPLLKELFIIAEM